MTPVLVAVAKNIKSAVGDRSKTTMISTLCVSLLMAVLMVGVPAMGQPVLSGPQESTGGLVEDEASWLSRTLHRYFGNSENNNAGEKGVALESVDQYLQFAGLPIEVVIVYQVLNFKDGWNNEKGYSSRTLTNLASPLHTYTHDSVVRNYLTFKQGDKLDPFDLADSERMLRDLEFISDARIALIHLDGEIESVAVVVEVKDRWPFGVEGKVITTEKYSFNLYSTNVAGLGVRFSNEFLFSKDGTPAWGYEGDIRKENIAGSFLDAEIGYEDSYRRLERKLLLERRLLYPGLNYLGGILFDQIEERGNKGHYNSVPSKYEISDVWLGRNIRLYEGRESLSTARSVIVPAATAYRKIFTQRPYVSQDTSRQYHNRKGLLVGLTYKRLKNYKTSYLFRDGESEDFLSGFVLKGSVGYEIREFEKRTVVAMESHAISIRNRGDIIFGQFDIGGYLKDWKMEEGLFVVGGGYITPLLGEGSYRHRLYSRLAYTLGLGRYPFDHIYLDDNSGLRGLSRGLVEGNQRIAGQFEYRLFTPVRIFGFRMSLLLYSDVGMIAGEKDPIFKKKIYTASGIGFRLRNPDLVLPMVQLRVGLLSNVEQSGVALSIKIGNVSDIGVQFPSVKPSALSYE